MKFLNERPMEELVWDGRLVMFRTNSGAPYIIEADESTKNSKLDWFLGWVEIFAPEPKPDANGWYNWDEAKPDFSKFWLEYFINSRGEEVVVAHSSIEAGGYDATLGGSFKIKWKYFELPIND